MEVVARIRTFASDVLSTKNTQEYAHFDLLGLNSKACAESFPQCDQNQC